MYIATCNINSKPHDDLVADHLEAMLESVKAQIAQITDDDEAQNALKLALLEVLAASLNGSPEVVLLK